MILSPITNAPADVVDTFDVQTIIKGYRQDTGIDVSSYYNNMQTLLLYQCPATKMRFFYPSTLAGDGLFYSRLEEREGYYTEWKWEYEKAFLLIKEHSKVLDIGCGRGAFLYKLKEEKNCEVHGLELNPSAFKTLQQRGIAASMQPVEAYSQQHKEAYDAVCFFQVLEHIPDTKSFLDAAISCLKPGGLLIAAVPHNKPYLYGFDKYDWLNLPPHHMVWWNDESLRNLSLFFPLEVQEIVVSDFRDYNNYLHAKEINLSITAPHRLKWFKVFKPVEKQWIQIIRSRLPGFFVMAVYFKK